jgi:hypothetical protein
MFALLALLLPPEPPATNVVYGPVYHEERSIVLPEALLEPTESPVSVVEIEEEESPVLTVFTSCMYYLQLHKNLAISGDAIDQVPNKPLIEVEVGDVIILNYDGVGHVAYVEQRFPKAVWVSETNYRAGEYSERAIKLNDPRIVGIMSVSTKE